MELTANLGTALGFGRPPGNEMIDSRSERNVETCRKRKRMQSLLTSSGIQDRPRGVIAVSGLLGLVAVVSLAFAILLVMHAVPLSYGSALLQGGLEQGGPIAFLIYCAVVFALALALWTRRGWARRLTILFDGIGVALAVPAISSAVVDGRTLAIAKEGVQIMLRVAVIFYLSQEPVRDWFATRQP